MAKNEKKSKNNEDSDDRNSITKVLPSKRFMLAIGIVLPAFILIGYMIFLQQNSLENTIDNIKNINAGLTNEEIKILVKETFEEYNKNRQSLLNSLLPLFAAWVGAVVAFYFGSENLQQAQKTLDKVLTPRERLASKTIADVIKENPLSKEVVTVKMDDSIKDVKSKFYNDSNVLVVSSEIEPMGVLYSGDLSKQGKIILYEEDKINDSKPLKDIIESIISDKITKSKWSKDKGIRNFATLAINDNLLQAKEKMEEMSHSKENILSVRGIVINKSGKVEAIINFADLTEGIIS